MKTIAILIESEKVFNHWVKKNGNAKNKYVHVNCIENTFGYVFDRVIKSEDWNKVKDSNKIYLAAINRMKI